MLCIFVACYSNNFMNMLLLGPNPYVQPIFFSILVVNSLMVHLFRKEKIYNEKDSVLAKS